MKKISLPLQIRWSDIDANNHLRHSVYYDYGAYCRIQIFTEFGITMDLLKTLQIGPVILREEAIFRREIKFEDKIIITAELSKSTDDFSRWSFRHFIMKSDGTVATTINVDGTWIDLQKRKLAVPPPELHELLSRIPRSEDFERIVIAARV